MKSSLLVVSTYVLISLSGIAADSIPKSQQGTSSVTFSKDKDGNKSVEIHNHTYLFADSIYLEVGKTSKPTAFLISQDVTSTQQMLSDAPPVVKLKDVAWASKEDFPRKQLWTLETEGNSSTIEERLFEVKRNGYEDDFDSYRYFRMADGKKLFTSNTPALTVYSSDDISVPRYFGFRDQFEDNELSKEMTDKKIAGIVTYANDDGVLKKIAIFGWSSDDKPSPPSAYLKYEQDRVQERELYLRANKETDGDSLGHFSLVIDLSEVSPIEIPFDHDAPQLDKATLPKGFSLELVP